MEVSVSGRHTTVSETLRSQAVDKIGRLDKYLGGMDRAEVHFWEEKNARSDRREFCEVTIEGHGHHIRCKVSASDGFTAIDLAVDKLERQIRKLKTKVERRRRSRARPDIEPELVPESLLAGGDDHEPVYKIVKTKRFDLTAMEAQEAALQMDLLNHDFYVFTNADTGKSAVVYRRDDGDIGLIDVD
ncbi:MAG: ribosome-associated translation inhibitor RaiA [Acidimicrobiia bacterium]|nr:ribosome-associated translation inhibitor RaiA [Acidimicrobiia bacterium]